MGIPGQIRWKTEIGPFMGDVGGVFGADKESWCRLGAMFSSVDDGEGETAAIAVGAVTTDIGDLEFGILDYQGDTTYLLVPASGPDLDRQAAHIAFALREAGISSLEVGSASRSEKTPAEAVEPLPWRHRWLALSVLSIAMTMIALDTTIVSVALPSIQVSLGFSQANLAWVVGAYLIPFGGLLAMAGRLGELVGQRLVFLAGLAVFTLGSLLCAGSQSQEALIVARFIQGSGAALASAVALAMIVDMFPEPELRSKAIGAFGLATSAAGLIGLLLGGLITEAIDWRWIFVLNIPAGVTVGAIARQALETHEGTGFKLASYIPGAALLTVASSLAVLTVLQAPGWGWVEVRTFAMGTSSLVLFAAFFIQQARVDEPLMPIRLLRSRNVVGTSTLESLLTANVLGVLFIGALYMQNVLGYSPLEIGFAFLPTAVAIGALSLGFSGSLTIRLGPRPILIIGVSLIFIALLLLARLPVHANYVVDLLPPLLLLGLGGGVSLPATTVMAVSSSAPDDAGITYGFIATSMRIGGAIGLALIAAVSTERAQSLIDSGVSNASALTSGYQLAYLVGAGWAAAGVAISIFLRPQKGPSKAALDAVERDAQEPIFVKR